MPRNITITFADGTTHVYANTPDTVTPDQVEARATKDFGKPVKDISGQPVGGAAGGAVPAARPQAKHTFLGDIGDTIGASVNKFVADQKADISSNKAASERPILQQLVSLPGDFVTKGIPSALQEGGDLFGIAASPVAGLTHAIVRPAAETLGGAAYDAGFPTYGSNPVQEVLAGHRPTRAESQVNTERYLTSSLGLIAPGRGAVSKAMVSQYAGGAPATAADALTSARASPPVSGPPVASAAPQAAAPAAPAAAPALGGEDLRAASVLAKQARAANVAVPDAIAAARQSGTTVAENISPGAEGMLAALGRRAGTTGDQLTGVLAQRNATLPGRFESAVSDATGVDRNMVAGNVDEIAKEAQARVKPQFNEFEQLGPVSSPTMDEILQRPAVKKWLKVAVDNARNQGAPEADVEMLQTLADGLPTDTGPKGAPNAYVDQATEYLQTRGAEKALRRALGPSLNEYLALKGGLADRGGDLAAMDAHLFHRGTPFQRKLVVPTGMGVDDAAQSAWEAGYFPDKPQAPTDAEFTDAVRNELAGKKLYARPATEAAQVAGRIEDFGQKLQHYGIDTTGKTPVQVSKELSAAEAEAQSYQDLLDHGTASHAPDTVIEARAVPTPRVLYDVKRVADADKVARDEDMLVNGSRSRTYTQDFSLDKAWSDFRGELQAMVEDKGFDYKGMVSAGGEAPRLKSAFRDGKALIVGNDAGRLARETAGMTALERKTALGGFVRDVLDRAQAKQGIAANELKRYSSDDFASRVGLMAGDPAAGKRFQSAVAAILRERRGQRMMPRTNSITGELGQANSELDGAGLGDLKINSLKPKKIITDAVLSKAQSALDFFATPGRTATRNALGAQLIDPDRAEAALSAYNAARATSGLAPVSRAAFAEIVRLAGPSLRTGAGAAVARAALGGNDNAGEPAPGRKRAALH